ncbi:UNVERIFIED_CONTAM: hypothetical protein FKN15_048689 [Acipenser sinensis]
MRMSCRQQKLQQQQQQPGCYCCAEPGHSRTNCPWYPFGQRPQLCPICGGEHYVAHCPVHQEREEQGSPQSPPPAGGSRLLLPPPQQQRQQQQPQQLNKRWWSRVPTKFGPPDWAAEQEQWRKEGAPMCSTCGEFGHVREDCPYGGPQFEEAWNQGLVGDAAEWFWAVDQTRSSPAPKREEPECPAPKRGELVRPQPKRGESVRPQPKRGKAEHPQPRYLPVEGEFLLVPPPPHWEDCVSLPPPPAEGEFLRVPPPPPWEDDLSLPPPPAEEACLLVPPPSPPPAEGAYLLVSPLPPSQPEGEEQELPPLQPEGEEQELPPSQPEGEEQELPPSQPEGEEQELPPPPPPEGEQQELPLSPPPPPEGEEQELPLPSRQDGPKQKAGGPQLPLHRLLKRARGKTAGSQWLRRGPTLALPLVLVPLLQLPPKGPLPSSPPEGPLPPCRASLGGASSPSLGDASSPSLGDASLAPPKDASLAPPKDASLAPPKDASRSTSPGAACCSASPWAAFFSAQGTGYEGEVELPLPPPWPGAPLPSLPPEGPLPLPPEGLLLLPSLGVARDPDSPGVIEGPASPGVTGRSASPGVAGDPASPGVAILWPEPHRRELPAMKKGGENGKKQRQRRKQQLPTPSSAATPPTPPSPPSREIWEWLVHPEADLFHDLPTALSTLWHRDGERWEEWEREHHPGSLQEIAVMVQAYLAIDMGEIPLLEEKGVEPLPSPREGEPLPSPREGELLPSPKREEPERPQPEREEPERPQPEGEEPEREESVRPRPEREESVHPRPEREESVRPRPEREEPELSLPLPPAEGEQMELTAAEQLSNPRLSHTALQQSSCLTPDSDHTALQQNSCLTPDFITQSMLTGLMYHRPEDPLGYLESCLQKARELGGPERVRWDTFITQDRRPLPPINGGQSKKTVFRAEPAPLSPYRRYERLPPIQAQFSIESDSDMTVSTVLIQEYDLFDPSKPRPPIIFVVGGPGSGKGTQTAKMAQRYGYVCVSVGEILRNQLLHHAPSDRKWELIAKIIANGELAPQIGSPDLVVLLACSNPQLWQRLEKRASQQGRPDDNTHAIERRLETFKQNIGLIAKYYQERSLVVRIDADREEGDIFADISATVEERLFPKGIEAEGFTDPDPMQEQYEEEEGEFDNAEGQVKC